LAAPFFRVLGDSSRKEGFRRPPRRRASQAPAFDMGRLWDIRLRVIAIREWKPRFPCIDEH
jgi:hypothetical protein